MPLAADWSVPAANQWAVAAIATLKANGVTVLASMIRDGGDPSGLANLLIGISQSPTFRGRLGLSFAPVVDSGSSMPSIAVIDGARVFEEYGLGYLDARQYCAGGEVPASQFPATVAVPLSSLPTTACPSAKTIGLSAANCVIGMSPHSVLGAQTVAAIPADIGDVCWNGSAPCCGPKDD